MPFTWMTAVQIGLLVLFGCTASGGTEDLDGRAQPLSGRTPVLLHPTNTLLLSAAEVGDPWPMAGIAGRVAIHDGCATLTSDGITALVIWHASLRLDAAGRIIDLDGNVIAVEGQWIEGAGGEVHYFKELGRNIPDMPPDCGQTQEKVRLFMP